MYGWIGRCSIPSAVCPSVRAQASCSLLSRNLTALGMPKIPEQLAVGLLGATRPAPCAPNCSRSRTQDAGRSVPCPPHMRAWYSARVQSVRQPHQQLVVCTTSTASFSEIMPQIIVAKKKENYDQEFLSSFLFSCV